MRLRLSYALVPLVLFSSFTFGQSEKLPVPEHPYAEVRFADGSVVRVAIVQQELEVQTKYGMLTIPVREIRRIEFGVHLPPEVDDKIQVAIRSMGSNEFKSREDAVVSLVKLGAQAYPAVLKASRSQDLEVARRAHKVASSIQEATPRDELRTKVEDTIHTAEFTVSGRILSASLRARSVHFGDLALRLVDLRQVHLRNYVGKMEVAVDAAHYGSELNQWLDTGVDIEPNTKLVIDAEGQVDLWPQGPGQYMTSPAGFTTTGKGGQHKAGLLLGRVGANGKVFVVGDRCEETCTEQGRLFLHIVPSPWNNASSGSFRAQISAQALLGRQ